MSWSTKLKRFHIPSYAVIAIMAFAAAGSLWLPRIIHRQENIVKAAYQPVSFSTPVTIASAVTSTSNTRIIDVNGTYFVAFTSSSGSNHNVYVTKSTNSGASWSAPVTAFSTLYLESGTTPSFSSFVYNTARSELALTAINSTGYLTITTSTIAGTSWSTPTVIELPIAGAGRILGRNAFGFSTSTGMYAVAYANSSTVSIATSTNGVTWTTSTISMIASTYASNSQAYIAYPLAIDVRGNTIQVIYDMNITTPASAYELVYASSTNMGGTWTTSTITGQITSPISQVSGLSALSSAAFNRTGNPGVIYNSLSAISFATLSQTSTPIYAVKNGATWTTSSYHGGALTYTLGTNGVTGANRLQYFSTDYPLVLYVDQNTYPTFAVNTSSAFTTNTVSAAALQLSTMQSMAYSTTSQQVAIAFIDSNNVLKISTTTLRDVTVNSAASAAVATAASFSTSGNGYVTVTGTVSDTDNDIIGFTVEHSSDNGTTWASSTIALATSTLSSSLTTSTGQVSNILLTSGSQSFTIVFNTQADGVTSTSQFKIRLTPFDDLGLRGTPLVSPAGITVDNVAPSAPSTFTFTLATSSIAFSWSDVSGTSNYTVSSTAGTATTTSATTTSYTSLTPNTGYSFQVKGTDAYSNVGSFSTVTTTYTNPNAPTTVAATSNGTTSLVVTWSANSNGTGTVYQLLNVTSNSTVGTTTATSYTVQSLSAGTSYQFAVRAQYLGDSSSYSAYSSTSTAVSTDAAASSGGGGAVMVSSQPPVVVPVALVTPAATIQQTFSANVPTPITVGASSHTVTVTRASAQAVTMTIQSDPITVTLQANEVRELDTNNDGVKDLRAVYLGLSAGKPRLVFTTLADEGELKNTFTINAGAYQTQSQKVRLMINSTDAVQMAISNTSDFTGASFTSFAKQMDWTLPTGNGLKTVFIRLRSGSGGMVTVSDSIELVGSSAQLENVPVKVDINSAQTTNKPVTPIKHRQLRSGSRGTDVTALQLQLQNLGFFPKNVKANGQFGPTTVKSVKAFQKAHKISQVGYVGPATWKALDASL